MWTWRRNDIKLTLNDMASEFLFCSLGDGSVVARELQRQFQTERGGGGGYNKEKGGSGAIRERGSTIRGEGGANVQHKPSCRENTMLTCTYFCHAD